MDKIITKVKLENFKRFREFSLELGPQRNILIGDNESGKSSILQSIDLVLSGSRSKVETLGLDRLMNIEAVGSFFEGEKKFDNLPQMQIEIFFNEQKNHELNGRNNSDEVICDGLLLRCLPMEDYSNEIIDILKAKDNLFPFEYYSIRFLTFSGEPYDTPRRFIRHLLLDSSQINNDYATREYIKSVYRANVKDSELHKHKSEYRSFKDKFQKDILCDINNRQKEYQFAVVTNTKSNLETDLTITENSIPIDNKGKGRQCIIKTEFAIQKKQTSHPLDILLLEEPENHLSHTNMKSLVSKIAHSEGQQMIVTTHNSLISTRLDLRNAILLNSTGTNAITLNNLDTETSDFFIKAPDNNVLEFVLSRNVILVEGDSEYILMPALFKKVMGYNLDESNIHIVSIGGTSFKRYMKLAKCLDMRTAVIRDNDGDYADNCCERYKDYISDRIRVFAEKNNDIYTFEKAIYINNKELCDDMFSSSKIKQKPQDYMLNKNNKTTVALRLLKEKSEDLNIPEYIKDAIQWITE